MFEPPEPKGSDWMVFFSSVLSCWDWRELKGTAGLIWTERAAENTFVTDREEEGRGRCCCLCVVWCGLYSVEGPCLFGSTQKILNTEIVNIFFGLTPEFSTSSHVFSNHFLTCLIYLEEKNHLGGALKSQFNQITKNAIFSVIPIVVSSHADRWT